MSDFALRCKTYKPPACPKRQKATTLRTEKSRNSLLPSSKKHQRDQQSTDKHTQTQPTLQIATLSSIDSAVPSPNQKPPLRAQQQRNTEYQQYTRRNYFTGRNKGNQVEVKKQSRLTQNIVSNRSLSKEEQKRTKSKSALNYAKYFIRQIESNPSEESPSQAFTSNNIKKQGQQQKIPERQNTKNTISIFMEQNLKEKKQESREKLSHRLKSLKKLKYRSRQKASSISKDKISKQKQEKKIVGNIVSLSDQQYNILRMKARARNKKVMIRIKQLNSNSKLSSDYLFLEMSSKIDRSFSQRKQYYEKVELHLQILNLIPSYVKEFKQIYEETQCWEELIFLVYKKFYIERLKVQYALGFYQNMSEIHQINPFKFDFCEISSSDLLDFKNTIQAVRIESRICEQNIKIQSALRNLYNHIIEKSGYHINLIQKDNFSEQIYFLMNEELKLLEENENNGSKDILLKRMTFIMKICLMIAFLNGEAIHIDNFLTESTFNDHLFNKYKSFIAFYKE